MSDRRLRASVALVAAAGLAIAAYLTWVHFDDSALICTTGGCEAVQKSDYATLAGVPIALLGAAAYATVLGLVAWDTPAARTVTAAIALGALGFAVYLLALQAFVIEEWCLWCLANDVVIAPALAALAVARLRSSAPGGGSSA